ncbi:MAG: hypothetical protein NZL99_08465 [Burkholderiaceae bacterium]|nr:hypothetical protein [Burkholderiaceae bacterium]MCX8005160.1 hypothetical protein [Burkholderiaceae bacterium]
MLMRVRERGDEVYIELTGVAGRQQQVLLALNECQRVACACGGAPSLAGADIQVRAGANDMRIRLRSRAGLRFEAAAIYRCLRHALIEQPAAQTSLAAT